MAPAVQRFEAVLERTGRAGLRIPVPFEPDEIWGPKTEHRVGGSVGPCGIRGSLERSEHGWGLSLGPAWARDSPFEPGHKAEVVMFAEGPQRDDLDEDIAAALAAEPAAGEFFDALAQFYRKAYLKWISSTTRRPEERARRIEATVGYLRDGLKERPRG